MTSIRPTKWLFDDCRFCQVAPAAYRGFGFVLPQQTCLVSFIKNTLIGHQNATVLMSNFHHMHVLIALRGSDSYVRKGELSWKDVLTPPLLAEMDEHGACVIGFMVVKPKHAALDLDEGDEALATVDAVFVDYIETRLRGHDVAGKMMLRMRKQANVALVVPCGIVDASVTYWKRYFSKRWCCETESEFDDTFADAIPDTVFAASRHVSSWKKLLGDHFADTVREEYDSDTGVDSFDDACRDVDHAAEYNTSDTEDDDADADANANVDNDAAANANVDNDAAADANADNDAAADDAGHYPHKKARFN